LCIGQDKVNNNLNLNTLIIGTIGITDHPQKEKCSTVNEELKNHQNHHCRYTGEIEYQVKEKCDEYPYHHEGFQNLHWVLIDYVNVVVHVMLPEDRKFYKLEDMWSDGAAEEHDE
jgi:ribosomal silencing factor RsfS